MTTYPKQNLKTQLALSFAQSFSSDSPDNYFLFMGKPESWEDDNDPPAIQDTLREELNAWRNIVALAKINQSNVIVGAKRFNWEYEKVFTQFDDTIDLYVEGSESQYYCITDEYNVYKCLSNNYNSKSLYKPSSTTSEEEILADGYIWKFLFKIREELYEFLTDDFIPIENLNSILFQDERSLQIDVRLAATPGSIENIILTKYGAAYPLAVTTDPNDTDKRHRIIEVLSADSFKLSVIEDLDLSDGIYEDYYELYISEGPGAGKKSTITEYTVEDGVVTVTLQDEIPEIEVNSVYRIYPKITIIGDGSGASCIPVMNEQKIITDISILNSGTLYHYADVEIYRKNSTEENKTLARAILSPVEGHGYNPFKDLGASMTLIYVPLRNAEKINDIDAKTILTNDFRQIGLIKNVLKNDEDDLVPITVDSDLTNYIDIENVNSKTLIYIETAQNLLSLLSTGQVLTQGSDNNNYQARGIIETVELQSANNYIITLSSTNGRFQDSDSSSYPIIIDSTSTELTGTITGIVVTNLYDEDTFPVNSYILGTSTASTAKISKWECNPYGLNGRLYIKDIKGKFRNSYYSQSSGSIVLVRGERIVGYSYVNETTGELVGLSPSTVGIIKAIGSYDSGSKPFFKVSYTFDLIPASGSLTDNLFTIDDKISNSSGVEGRVISYTFVSGSSAKLEVTGLTGSFEIGDILRINNNTEIVTNAEISSITSPEVLPYSGEIIYIQNVLPISSANDSEEHIKLLIKF